MQAIRTMIVTFRTRYTRWPSSPNGRYGGVANFLEVQLWDVARGRELRVIEGHFLSLAFSPDGRFLLTGGHDGPVACLWDATSGNEVRRFEGHTNNIESVAFSPDGHSVLSGSVDGTARLWNAESGKELRRFVTTTQ